MYAAKLVGYLVGSVLIYGASQAESLGENEYGPDPKGRASPNQPRRLNLGTPSAVHATGGTTNITVNVSEQRRPLPKDSLTEMLEKLGSLKERGLLTEEEFERQKEKILEQM